ncbi:MAG: DUF7948 domain-containing protein [Planctomycetota bacterium]|jgi:hypothetical protein
MHKLLLIIAFLPTSVHSVGFSHARPTTVPQYFTENVGQHTFSDVQYYVRDNALEVGFAAGRVFFNAVRWQNQQERSSGRDLLSEHRGGVLFALQVGEGMTRPQAVQPLASYSNYFLGPDPKKWHIGVRHYGRILYTNAYPGIDLVYFFDKNGDLTYELYVKPGADPSSIELTYEAIDGVESGNDSAHMNILSANGCLHDGALRCYQEIGPKRIPVASAFEKTGSSSYSVVLLEPYDESRTLVIDPPLAFSTYWGSGTAVNRTVVVDTQGNIYMSGGTSSTTWPTTPGVYQTTHSGTSWPDVTTAKFDSDGQLIWSTFLGGPFEDYAYVSAVNANGELYISGRSGDGFPTTPGSFDTTFNGGYFQGSVHAPTDAFVVKLSADATQLLYSTYIGGNGNDNGRSIHLLPSGHLLIGGGNTTSTDLPTTAGVLKPNRGGGKDSWVAKVIPDGSDLDFCTYFGPNNDSGGSGD